jgi:ABC-type multidrug transport system ATPase subunit
MSGMAFMEYHHALLGLPSSSRHADCERLFDRVGLERGAAGLRVGRYSRGMLQRLALAQALLGNPRYLYLDEPISGVDPAGVVVFRDILSHLSDSGATVLINSHQLAEVERICDRVVFVKQGVVEAMETTRAGASHARVLRVRISTEQPAPDGARLAGVAAAAGATFRGWTAPDARFAVADDAGATQLIAALVGAGVAVIEASPEEGRLERLFTGGASPAGPASPISGVAASQATGGAPAPTPGANP